MGVVVYLCTINHDHFMYVRFVRRSIIFRVFSICRIPFRKIIFVFQMNISTLSLLWTQFAISIHHNFQLILCTQMNIIRLNNVPKIVIGQRKNK